MKSTGFKSPVNPADGIQTAVERRVCPVHGEYEAHGAYLPGWHEMRWSGCPVCAEERKVEAKRKEREGSALDRKIAVDRIVASSLVPARFMSRTFDNFRAETQQQRTALKIVKAYADTFETRLEQGGGLVLCGKPGTGKTHLACAIAMQIAKTGRTSEFLTVMQAVRRVKQTYQRGSDVSEQQALSGFMRPDLLILDEVGVQWGTDAEKVILFEIINGRYNEMLPTILISNLQEAELGAFIGERAVDRMREGGGAVLAFDWPSYRGMVAKDEGLSGRAVEPPDWKRLQGFQATRA